MTAERAKRVGVFVTGAFTPPERLDSVSGHVQIPLAAAGILRRAGYDVTLITTKPPGADCLPRECPEGLAIRTVQHPSAWCPDYRLFPGRAIRQGGQLLALLRQERFDVIHFFGGIGTGWLLGALKQMGVTSTAFYSPIKAPPPDQSALGRWALRGAFRRVERVLTMSDYVAHRWTPIVGARHVAVMRPGVGPQHLRRRDAGTPRDSVLFWRCARHTNGVDIAMASFRRLAPAHPDLRFVFAVRPHDPYEAELLELGAAIDNIDVHIYPYENGISLPLLLARARFVVQPFRHLSINPQLAILESLYAGVPVIATDVESNRELVCHEENGLLIPPEDEGALSEAVERLLADASLLARLTRNARSVTQRRWNWDVFARTLLDAYER